MTELFCTIALFTVTRTTPDMSAVELLQLHTISLPELVLRIHVARRGYPCRY